MGSDTMKAMVLTAPNEVSLQERPIPKPGTGETLVRVTHSGICGTDLKIYQGGIPVEYPLVMGHESIGIVVEINGETGDKNIKPGSRVIVDPVYYCGHCYQCHAGQTNICVNGGLIGRDIDGGFAEYMVAPSMNVHLLPESVSNEAAALIQPMTTCVHAHRIANIQPGEGVIVLGLGVTGLIHVQMAKAYGAYPVIGITRSEWKRELAKELGADFTFEPSDDIVEKIKDITLKQGADGADVVIESVGQIPTLAQSMEMVRTGGRIVPFGIYTAKDGALPYYQMYFKEIAILNARAAKPEDFPSSINYVGRSAVNLDQLITHKVKLTDMKEALDMLEGGASRCIKIILDHT